MTYSQDFDRASRTASRYANFGNTTATDAHPSDRWRRRKTIAALVLVAAIVAAPIVALQAAPERLTAAEIVTKPDPRLAWKDGLDVPGHRLVGLGCGAARQTLTAEEEDHFPAPCYAVGGTESICGYDKGDLPTVGECARYMGEGW